jgi:hypothetical protein
MVFPLIGKLYTNHIKIVINLIYLKNMWGYKEFYILII